jgi:hypothetical protein
LDDCPIRLVQGVQAIFVWENRGPCRPSPSFSASQSSALHGKSNSFLEWRYGGGASSASPC